MPRRQKLIGQRSSAKKFLPPSAREKQDELQNQDALRKQELRLYHWQRCD